ncbi:MAG: biosynthetic-type acetolactate synthase large subunit [Oscillospiraceae bacterium]|nr:biosynthetic-type acetolactate synthase large subunit [Oscillospiraceae bacterium]
MKLCGSDIIVRTLIDQGVDVLYGYPGGQVLDIFNSLFKYQNEIRHVLTAHEQGAAHAADGYARSTGRVGVCLATSGPGATNLVTGIATAFLDSVPMVAITGNVANTVIGTDGFQEIDITGITLPITKHNYFVTSIDDLQDTIRAAFRLAASGRPGPVLVDVAKDVQVAMYDYEPLPPLPLDEPFAAKDIRIQEAAACINEAQRPYIYFGGGLITSEAQDELLQLAERIDAPISCSLMGISAIPTDYPRFLGMQGLHGHFAASTAMHHADVIIALGCRFNDRCTGNRNKFVRSARIVHIDIDGAELSKSVQAAHGLRGDIKKTLEKLLPLIQKQEHPEWQAQIARFQEEEAASLDNREGLTPRNVMNIVNNHLTETTPVATDVGQHQMWAAQYLNFKNPRRFISSGGLGTMGFGMGAAIGTQMATKEHPILITGDGSFGMNLTEMATAFANNVPMVILLLNNQVLGMVRQLQTILCDGNYSNTDLHARNTNFVMVAQGFGLKARRVSTPEELDEALAEAFAYNGPCLIECPIDKDELVLPMVKPGGSMGDIMVRIGD